MGCFRKICEYHFVCITIPIEQLHSAPDRPMVRVVIIWVRIFPRPAPKWREATGRGMPLPKVGPNKSRDRCRAIQASVRRQRATIRCLPRDTARDGVRPGGFAAVEVQRLPRAAASYRSPGPAHISACPCAEHAESSLHWDRSPDRPVVLRPQAASVRIRPGVSRTEKAHRVRGLTLNHDHENLAFRRGRPRQW